MRKVITIPEVTGEQKESKDIEFTHHIDTFRGWVAADGFTPQEHYKVVYLGKCELDGDMFVAYSNGGFIRVFKGHLNNGTY